MSGSGLDASNPGTNIFGTSSNKIDPRLAPLSSNGCFTQTHALLPESPAIDAGETRFDSDQRGDDFIRNVGSGAVEYWESLVIFSTSDLTVTEGNTGSTNAVLNATLLGGNTSVPYSTVDGTATAGIDYIETAGTLNFGSVGDTQQITVPVVGDPVAELNETFRVKLTSPTVAVRDGDPLVTIEADDTGVILDSRQVLAVGNQLDNDLIVTVSGSTAQFNLDGTTTSFPLSSFDTIYFDANDGDDSIDSTAIDSSFQPDSIYGGSGNARLFGDGSADLLVGGTGNDRLHGNDGNDILLGNEGDDTLRGDQRDDILIAERVRTSSLGTKTKTFWSPAQQR